MTNSTAAINAMEPPLPREHLFRKRRDTLTSLTGETTQCHERPTVQTVDSADSSHAVLPVDVQHRRNMMPTQPWNPPLCHNVIVKFVPKFILEVLGGAGAIWGFSEACGLRRPETVSFWRPAALVVGFLFFLRFLRQLAVALAATRPYSYDVELGMNKLEQNHSTCSSAESTSTGQLAMIPQSQRPLSPTELTALTCDLALEESPQRRSVSR